MVKLLSALVLAAVLCTGLGACGYAGVATAGDAAVVARNDWFLFGALRMVFVCKITPGGLTQCANAETP
jgi:hypothetical protein